MSIVARETTVLAPAAVARHDAGPIVVASDGKAPAAAALSMAGIIRKRTGNEIRVVSVVEPLTSPTPAPVMLTAPEIHPRLQQRYDLVRQQVDRVLGTNPEVPIDMRIGWVPEQLAETVRDCDASFFIAGLVHHGRLERLTRAETPLSVLRGARVPVLAVPWGRAREPRCVIVGVDCTEATVTAAARAAPLLGSADKVFLVLVQEPLPPLAELERTPPTDIDAIEAAFDRIRGALDLPDTTSVETRILEGKPAFELADFADYVRADLIVLGHQHRGLWGRLLHSSVAERVYRAAPCGVLIVPDDAIDHARVPRGGPEVVTEPLLPPTGWGDALRAFSRRNAGRRVNLEVFTTELGAQSASVNFPFVGIDYDPVTASVDIMLGDTAGGFRHATHSVRDVSALEVSRIHDRGDWALRIVHDGGETLLTFVR